MNRFENLQEFIDLTDLPDEQIDLAKTALLIASVEYPNLDIEKQLGLLDSLARVAARRIGDDSDPLARVNRLTEYLFDEVGFSGNQDDYYNPGNSLLNDVLARRVGIPITLCLICIEVGRRVGIPLVAIGMPGHLLIRHQEIEGWFIDPFNGGILISKDECAQRLMEISENRVRWNSSYLAPIGNREFVARMLRNLKGIYLDHKDYPRALDMLDRLVIIHPKAEQELRDRGVVHYRLERYEDALDDFESYLDCSAPGQDTRSVEKLVGQIRQSLGKESLRGR